MKKTPFTAAQIAAKIKGKTGQSVTGTYAWLLIQNPERGSNAARLAAALKALCDEHPEKAESCREEIERLEGIAREKERAAKAGKEAERLLAACRLMVQDGQSACLIGQVLKLHFTATEFTPLHFSESGATETQNQYRFERAVKYHKIIEG